MCEGVCICVMRIIRKTQTNLKQKRRLKVAVGIGWLILLRGSELAVVIVATDISLSLFDYSYSNRFLAMSFVFSKSGSGYRTDFFELVSVKLLKFRKVSVAVSFFEKHFCSKNRYRLAV